MMLAETAEAMLVVAAAVALAVVAPLSVGTVVALLVRAVVAPTFPTTVPALAILTVIITSDEALVSSPASGVAMT